MKSIYLTFVGVTFSAKLDGDSKAPCRQRLTEDERNEKEKVVFNKAINELSAYWKGATFNDFEVINTKISYGEHTLKWDDYDQVKTHFKAPAKDLHNYTSLTNECKSMLQHADRHLNEAVFIKCNDASCGGEWRSTEIKTALERMKYRFPAPKLSKQYNGHYETYLKYLSNSSFEYNHSFQQIIQM